MSEELDLSPPRALLRGQAGNDLDFIIELDFDASTGEHVLLVSTKPDNEPFLTFTDGDGLVIETVDGKTSIAFRIDRDVTLEHNHSQLYIAHDLTMNDTLRTQVTAKLELRAGIPHAS